MSPGSKKWLARITAVVAMLVVILMWPVGTWLAVILIAGVLAYAWGIYPLLLAIAGSVKRSSFVPLSGTTADREAGSVPPSSRLAGLRRTGKREAAQGNGCVAILFAAYNEESVIRKRLENLIHVAHLATDLRQPSTINHPPSLFELWWTSQPLTIHFHVGIDGSTDRTAEIAREFAKDHPNVHIHEFEERRGKVAVLKDLVREVESKVEGRKSKVDRDDPGDTAPSLDLGPSTFDRARGGVDILVFTDANTMFRPDALEKLLRHFDDPGVGGVCGRLVFNEPQSKVKSQKPRQMESSEQKRSADRTDNFEHTTLDFRPSTFDQPSQEGVYWQWENRMKERESNVDSCLGANGAIYAVKRELFWKDIPDNTVVDDFVIGMKVREQGFRVVYEPDAVAEEELPEAADEWSRRVRIGAGDYQALWLCRKCLAPRYGKFAWMFWSHKVLRWFSPHAVLFLVFISMFDVGCSMLDVRQGRSIGVLEYWGIGLVTAFVMLLLCALMGRLLRNSRSVLARPFRACDYFLTMQAALFSGFLRFCRGNLKGHWIRTPRRE